MSHHCPECQRILYSRRLKHCGYCGARIPESLRFTLEEIELMDKKIKESQEQQKRREQIAAEEDAAQRRATGDDGFEVLDLM